MMMKAATLVGLLVTLLGLVSVAEGVLFSTLNKTLVVTAQIQSTSSPMGVAKARVDHILINWSVNASFVGMDSTYEMVDLKLCYAPKSQVNRGWRKTEDDLHLDRSCKAADIGMQNFTAAGDSLDWLVPGSVPKAFYFIRAYALDASGNQVGFGQTTNKNKTTNIFEVEAISGRHTSLDITSSIFSVFAVLALFSYLGFETLLGKRKQSRASK